jgi:O-antigen ligase
VLTKAVFFLLIFCLPFQLGLHFWPSWSFLAGFRLDYLSPTLYFTDLIILLYIIFRHRQLFYSIKSIKTGNYILLFPFIILNILFSINPTISIFAWLRLLVYLCLFLTIAREPNLNRKIILPFSLSLLLVIGIEIGQLLTQSSLGGIFYLFGERYFNLATPNTAKTILDETLTILRPYSTFSHPNSLAGYLLICLLVIKKNKIRYLETLIILGILLTFSKAAILSLILLLLLPRLPDKTTLISKKILLLFTLVISLLPALNTIPNLRFNFQSSLLSRLYLGQNIIPLLIDHPLTGVGLNNFLPAIASYLPASQTFIYSLQPVHSLLLLLLSEIGLIGLCLIFLFLSRLNFKLLPLGLVIILSITGAVDHYWWTLPQNKLILILFFALIYNQNERQSLSNYKY